MNGIIRPEVGVDDSSMHNSLIGRLRAILIENRAIFTIVFLPTLLVALYQIFFVADQYESSADFIVRHSQSAAPTSGVGQLLGFGIGSSATGPEALMVEQYLVSHDAVAKLASHNNLVEFFQRPEADWLSRLRPARPTPERLLKYYQDHVRVDGDETSGILHLTVHTFRRDDSYHIAQQLLLLGEQQINEINDRTYKDNVTSSQRELDQSRLQLAEIQAKLTSYRRTNEDINPENTGREQQTLVTGLTSNLVQAKARLQAMQGVIRPDSPQFQALSRQVQALQAQIAGQSTKIAGPSHSVADRLSDYEELLIQREQVAKVYADAAVRLQSAQAEARRQQLYLVRVVQPNIPVKSEFPKRWETIAMTFAALFFAYAIGWLLWEGVKQHSL